MTCTSTGPRIDSSRSPSCSCSAAVNEGGIRIGRARKASGERTRIGIRGIDHIGAPSSGEARSVENRRLEDARRHLRPAPKRAAVQPRPGSGAQPLAALVELVEAGDAGPWRARERALRVQFGDGRSTRSITNTSSGSVAGSSRRPRSSSSATGSDRGFGGGKAAGRGPAGGVLGACCGSNVEK